MFTHTMKPPCSKFCIHRKRDVLKLYFCALLQQRSVICASVKGKQYHAHYDDPSAK
jgi:hypothetical protein